MLSYQHSYHAGNLADFHKHRLLAEALVRLVESGDVPLAYMETHAGRGVYDLASAEARKTGEAREGQKAFVQLPEDHPYRRCIAETRARYGADFYPGSPQIARLLLRPRDTLHLHELHPQEYAALSARIKAKNIRLYRKDGYKGVLSLAASQTGRGLVVVDPSYEVKTEYEAVSGFIEKLKERWPDVSVLLWYPLLEAELHQSMLAALEAAFPGGLWDEVTFPTDSPLRMKGSGIWWLGC